MIIVNLVYVYHEYPPPTLHPFLYHNRSGSWEPPGPYLDTLVTRLSRGHTRGNIGRFIIDTLGVSCILYSTACHFAIHLFVSCFSPRRYDNAHVYAADSRRARSRVPSLRGRPGTT